MGLSHRLTVANLDRTARRVFYYARNAVRDIAPKSLFRRQLDGLLERAIEGGAPVRERLDYYNKLTTSFTPGSEAVTVDNVPWRRSRYYYDFKEYVRFFDPGLRLDVKFGDIRVVPPVPSILKSRPIAGDNANSVVLNLNKFRHFHMPADSVPFSDKMPKVVWRGGLYSPIRKRFMQAVHGLDFCDAGTPSPKAEEQYRKPYLSIDQQRRYRYIVSLEGNDVATNLKWIMSSNSLCLMPEPTFETWFCEGWLKPGVHYVPLAPDFSDLADKVAYYERHPQEAEKIIATAKAYCRPFRDQQLDRSISLLVLYKYFVLSGQVEPDDEIWRFITDRPRAAPGGGAPARQPLSISATVGAK